jgi:hypothetical protein
MFGYYIEQSRKHNPQAKGAIGTSDVEGFNTSIKGFKTREEAQRALEEAEKEIRQSKDFRLVESRVYEYDN